MTPEQIKAIKKLEKAFNACGKLGIKFTGMDDNIIYATELVIENTPGAGNNYSAVADAYKENQYGSEFKEETGSLDIDGGIYESSGGW